MNTLSTHRLPSLDDVVAELRREARAKRPRPVPSRHPRPERPISPLWPVAA